jgi:hypothetical protein
VNEHPSRLTIERLSVDDLPSAASAEAGRHVASCAACRREVDELRAAQARLVSRMPPDAFMVRMVERRDRGAVLARRRRVRLGAVAVISALAAAAATFALVPRGGDQIRWKGSGATIHRSRDGTVQVLTGADTIRAGDALRIVVTLPGPESVAVWFVDAHGRVDRLMDEGARHLGAGAQAVPGSAVVDAPCVDMWLVLATGAAAAAGTEEVLRRAVAGGVPAGDAWMPANTTARALRCE